MEIKYIPQRSQRKVRYELEGNTLKITENGDTQEIDLANLPEEHNYPIVKVEGDSVTVIRFYGKDEKHLFES